MGKLHGAGEGSLGKREYSRLWIPSHPSTSESTCAPSLYLACQPQPYFKPNCPASPSQVLSPMLRSYRFPGSWSLAWHGEQGGVCVLRELTLPEQGLWLGPLPLCVCPEPLPLPGALRLGPPPPPPPTALTPSVGWSHSQHSFCQSRAASRH